MLLTASLLLLVPLCHASVSFVSPIANLYWSTYTDLGVDYTKSWEDGSWIRGVKTLHSNNWDDRRFRFEFATPQDPNADYEYNAELNNIWRGYYFRDGSPQGNVETELEKNFEVGCFTDPPYGGSTDALFRVASVRNHDPDDRVFDIGCVKLPPQFKLINCKWTGYRNEYSDDFVAQCRNGLMRAIYTRWDSDYEDRRWKFQCCNVENTPINLLDTYEASRVAAELTSEYTDGSRTVSVSMWARPNWYQRNANNPIKATYSLTKAFSDSSFWSRVCPRNGAFSSITQNADGFSFKCAELVDEIIMDGCAWTEDINEFKTGFTASCPSDGAIRGIQSYYSKVSDDRKFKLYCCGFTREAYVPNTNLIIKAKTSPHDWAGSGCVVTFDLCWNNDLYQGIMILENLDMEYTTDDIVKYDSCADDKALTVSTGDADLVNITEITVTVDNVDYKMSGFDAFSFPLIGSLLDNALSASSGTAKLAKLSNLGWDPESDDDDTDYLEVDLGKDHSIASVSVFPFRGSTIKYVTTYKLSYSIDGSSFTDYSATLNGPQQQTGYDFIDEANSVLDPPINASHLRFTPLTYEGKKSMRVEAYNGGSVSMSSVALATWISITDVRIHFPDNYLTACNDASGCTGALYTLSHSAEYLMTITECPTFVQGIPLIESLADDAFDASSIVSDSNFKPHQARPSSGYGWKPEDDSTADEHLEVDLGKVYLIESVSVYPRGNGGGGYHSYVKTYKLSYSIDGVPPFEDYPSILNGPQERTGDDSNDEANSALNPPIKARYLRFTPLTYLDCKTIRVEVYVYDIPEIGVILNGVKGNIDKKVLTWPFAGVNVGEGSIGALVNIHMEHLNGAPLCIESVAIEHALEGEQGFGGAYFADGVILSSDCGGCDFAPLSGIQYVPCYQPILSIATYEASLYTSVEIHSCAGANNLTAGDSKLFSLTVVGETQANNYISSSALSLETVSVWEAEESRDYTFQLPGAFAKATMVTFTNNDGDSSFCIDSVLINGVNAFLTDYWVGADSVQAGSLRTIPAVLEWPICDVVYTVTITSEVSLPTDPDSVATSTCVNRNRLVSTACEISQSFETYEEISWQQEIGKETSEGFTVEEGTSSSASFEYSQEYSFARSVEAGGGGMKVGFEDTFGVSSSSGEGREWSSSSSHSSSTTNMDVTTDGKVDGETIGIHCSGSVSVPPSQQIEYTMLMEQSEAEISTLTDMKMTKCSAFLYGDAGEDRADDPNNYIYIFGIKGKLVAKSATNCYVEFKQAEQIKSGGEDAITCGEERALAAREWGTYVPQCSAADHNVYMKCQCAFGDSRTLPTCGCVDETTGNLLDAEKAAVVELDPWQSWCEAECGPDSYSTSAAKAPPANEIKNKPVNEINNNDWWMKVGSVAMMGIMVAMVGAMLTYMVNSCGCIKRRGGYTYDYEAVGTEIIDHDIEKEIN